MEPTTAIAAPFGRSPEVRYSTGSDSGQRPEIGLLIPQKRQISLRAMEDNLNLFARWTVHFRAQISDPTNYPHEKFHLVLGFLVEP